MPWCAKCAIKNNQAQKGQWTGHAANDHDESKVRCKNDNENKEGSGNSGGSQSGSGAAHAAAAAAGITELDEEQLMFVIA